MKKILALAISLILIISSVTDGTVVFAKNIPDNSNLSEFASDLRQLVLEYDYNKTINDSVADDSSYNEKFPIQYHQAFNYANADCSLTDEYDFEAVLKKYNLPSNAFESERLIVKSKNRIDSYGAIECVSGYKDLHILQYASQSDALEAYEYYLSCDNIEYVEPDYISTVQAEVDDASISDADSSEYFYEIIDKVESWNSEEIGYDEIKDELAQRQLADVMVAVLDSGVDTDHEIFENRLIQGNVNLSSSGEENSCEDDYGHGTHVAGIIADNTLNNVMIKPYKVLNNRGKGTISIISIAVDMAVADGADIINMSITSEGESQTMTDSVNAATEQGVNVVVAAGNKKADLSKKYYSPACIESAITVSATTKKHTLASYSSFNGPIDIAAPGDNIKSSYLNNTYTLLDGTSMAAPQVAAGLAIIRSVYPNLEFEKIEERLKKYSIKMDENEGQNYFGSGILYLKYILQEIPRTAEPEFDVLDGEFSNSFKLTLSCPEKDAKILYVIHKDKEIVDIGFLNGTEYLEPLTISVDTKISAVAISKGKLFSTIVTHEYIRSNRLEEDKYDINNNGMITGYFGNDIDLIVPNTINGIKVTGVADSAFKDNQQIHSVILPDTAFKIGEHAFSGCLNLESVTGSGITEVADNSFELSTISNIPFEQLLTIGDFAFSGCNNLKNVDLTNTITIGKSAFENAKGLQAIKSDSVIEIGKAAFRGSDIISVDFSKISDFSNYVFENCSELVSVSFEKLETVSQYSFKDCISLKTVKMPVVKNIKANAFENSGIIRFASDTLEFLGNLAFRNCNLLKYVSLPNVTTVESYSFNGCTNLRSAYLPKLKELDSNTFSKCENLKSLWFPAVEKVNWNAFDNSYIEYVQFDKVETISSLPNTLKGIILPSICVSVSGTVPKTDFIIYGYANTYAEQYANEINKDFKVVPAMLCEVTDSVSLEEKYITAYALGFNCTYQWYKNDTVSNENGVPIENATNFWYEPKREDNAACYYCVITSDDSVNFNEVVTTPIANAPEYQEADYTAYNYIVEEAKHIDRELYTNESLTVLDELLARDVSGYSLAEQGLITQHIEDIKNAISSLILDFALGDINDDGKISLLDARLALKAVSGTEELDRLQSLSADMNEDGKISLIDVRAILRIISEMAETE